LNTLLFEELDKDGSTAVRRVARGLQDELSENQNPKATLPLAQKDKAEGSQLKHVANLQSFRPDVDAPDSRGRVLDQNH
jgi:hypothetical protein